MEAGVSLFGYQSINVYAHILMDDTITIFSSMVNPFVPAW